MAAEVTLGGGSINFSFVYITMNKIAMKHQCHVIQ